MTAPTFESLDARIDRYRPLVLKELRAIVGRDPAGLYAWMRYHMGWEDQSGAAEQASPGKMLRSTAVLLAAELVGGNAHLVAVAGAAVDLVHNFSLLHDDIEDDSATRRGRSTVWTFAGVPQAINTGDGMYTLARLAMHRLTRASVADRLVVAAMAELDEACMRLVEGQYLDMRFEARGDVTLDEYVTMASGKTAAMFAAPFAIGALVGGANSDVVDAFREYGRHVGMAFQVLDDVLDCWGTARQLGKEPGGDLLARKKTYPVLAALEGVGGAERSALAAAYASKAAADEDYRVLAALVEQAGGRAAAEAYVDEQVRLAQAAASRVGLDGAELGLLDEYLQTATGRR
ncbi:MAG: polyprenyl synthetase family protein [Chloroflexota bacterium]